MPSRYEIVDEPEALEVDDDVYHPDQSVREISSSMRSLEPILSGSVSLKTVFCDPRWSRAQRQCCFGVIGVMILLCLAVLIALFVGLGKVVSFIEYTERIKNSGLTMFPAPNGPPDLLSLKLCPLKAASPSCHYNYSSYISEISDEIERYVNNTCSSTGRCSDFDLNLLGKNCTKEKDYGYMEGNPCVLLKLRQVPKWEPKLSKEFIQTLQNRKEYNWSFPLSTDNIPVYCSESEFTRSEQTVQIATYYPQQGFNTSYWKSGIEPLVMVQILNPQKYSGLEVRCRIFAVNLSEFEGVQEVEFMFHGAFDDFDIGNF